LKHREDSHPKTVTITHVPNVFGQYQPGTLIREKAGFSKTMVSARRHIRKEVTFIVTSRRICNHVNANATVKEETSRITAH